MLGKADVGFTVTVVVTAGNAVGTGTATAAPTAPVAAAPPVNTHPPVISSPNPLIQQGLTLSVGSIAWDSTPDTTYSLSWERCAAGVCRTIAGATGDRYTLLAADVGHTIVAVSTAHERRRLGLRPLRRDRGRDRDGRPALEDAAADLPEPGSRG